MQQRLMTHNEFQFDKVFNENTNNIDIYNYTVKPLVNFAINGGHSTVMVRHFIILSFFIDIK